MPPQKWLPKKIKNDYQPNIIPKNRAAVPQNPAPQGTIARGKARRSIHKNGSLDSEMAWGTQRNWELLEKTATETDSANGQPGKTFNI